MPLRGYDPITYFDPQVKTYAEYRKIRQYLLTCSERKNSTRSNLECNRTLEHGTTHVRVMEILSATTETFIHTLPVVEGRRLFALREADFKNLESFHTRVEVLINPDAEIKAHIGIAIPSTSFKDAQKVHHCLVSLRRALGYFSIHDVEAFVQTRQRSYRGELFIRITPLKTHILTPSTI